MIISNDYKYTFWQTITFSSIHSSGMGSMESTNVPKLPTIQFWPTNQTLGIRIILSPQSPLWCLHIQAEGLGHQPSQQPEQFHLSEKIKKSINISLRPHLLLFTSVRAPGPTATTVPCNTFCCAFSGMTIPPLVLVIISAFSIRTRSNMGISRFNAPA